MSNVAIANYTLILQLFLNYCLKVLIHLQKKRRNYHITFTRSESSSLLTFNLTLLNSQNSNEFLANLHSHTFDRSSDYSRILSVPGMDFGSPNLIARDLFDRLLVYSWFLLIGN